MDFKKVLQKLTNKLDKTTEKLTDEGIETINASKQLVKEGISDIKRKNIKVSGKVYPEGYRKTFGRANRHEVRGKSQLED